MYTTYCIVTSVLYVMQANIIIRLKVHSNKNLRRVHITEIYVYCSLIETYLCRIKLSATNIKMTSVFTMLRKCCNHPYLLEFPLTEKGEFQVDEQLVNCCGKVLLLDRMLPALIQQGHKVRRVE